MNSLIMDSEEEETEEYDLDEDREPRSPISPYKTDEVEVEIPVTVNYNMTFDSANNRWITYNDWASYVND